TLMPCVKWCSVNYGLSHQADYSASSLFIKAIKPTLRSTLFRARRSSVLDAGAEQPGQRRRHLAGEGQQAEVEHRCRAERRALARSEEHTSELQSRENLVCRLLLEKKHEPTWAAHRLKQLGRYRRGGCIGR